MAKQPDKSAEFIQLASPDERLRLVCRHVKAAYDAGRAAAVLLATEQEAQQLDDLLWTFSDSDFIPHVPADQAEDPVLEPVLLYCAGQQPEPADVLVNAAGGEPGGNTEAFAHVVDFAEVYDEDLREASRRRWSACRDEGRAMRYVK